MRHRILILVLLAGVVCCGCMAVRAVVAAESTDVQFTPQVTIPIQDTPFIAGKGVSVEGTTIGEWISAVYAFLSGTMGIIAAMMVMWGGIKWTTAGGNTGRVQEAKDTIYSAIIALVLTFGAYVLLYTINPSLVKIRDLTDLVTPIKKIEQALEAALPQRISEALIGNAGLTGTKNEYNAMACPTIDEMRSGIQVFLTGYYRPAMPPDDQLCEPSGGYKNFPCNISMQCWCKHGPSCGMTRCEATGVPSWEPCDMEVFDRTNYCNQTKSTSVPVEFPGGTPPFTAAGSSCFGFGTRFTISKEGSTNEVFTKPWVVADRGGDIRGRHFDLFTGTGEEARSRARDLTGEAMMWVEWYCPPQGDCVDLTETTPPALGE